MRNHLLQYALGFFVCLAACDDSQPEAAKKTAPALKRPPTQEAALLDDYKPICTVDPSNSTSWITFADPEVQKLYIDTMKWAQSASSNRIPVEEIQNQIEVMAMQKKIAPEQMAVDLYYAANAGVAAYPNPMTPLLDKHGEKIIPWLLTRITIAPSREERVFLFKRLLNQTGREKTEEIITSRLADSSLAARQVQVWSELQRHLSSLPK